MYLYRLLLGLLLALGSVGPVFAADEFSPAPYELPGTKPGEDVPRYDQDLDRPGAAPGPAYRAREFETPPPEPDPFPSADYGPDLRDPRTQPSLRKHCASPSRPSSLDKHCGGPY